MSAEALKNYVPMAVAVLLTAGCVSRDIEVKPELNVPGSFTHAGAAAAANLDDAAWWDSFGDEQLAQLVREALAHNRSLKAAQAGVEQALAASGATRADLFPTLGLTGRLAGLESQDAPVIPNGGTQVAQLGLGAQWEIDLFGQNRNRARAARQLVYASEEQRRAARLMVASSTARAYLDWLNAQARIEVLCGAIAVRKHMLELVRGREPEGLASSVDIDRAAAALSAAEGMLPKLELAAERLHNALAVLAGRTPQELVLKPAPWAALNIPQAPAVLPSTVLLRRPDVQAARRSVMAQMYALGAAKAAYYPKFNFVLAGESHLLRFSMQEMPDLNGLVGGAALTVSLPIFTAGKIRSEVRGQEARLDAVAAGYEQSILQAVADVESAYRAYIATGQSVISLRAAAASAASAAERSDGLYAGGLADLTDVLAAKDASLEQRDAFLAAALDQAEAVIELYGALGGMDAAPEKAKSERKKAR